MVESKSAGGALPIHHRLPFRRQLLLDFLMWGLLFGALLAAIWLRQQTLYASRDFVAEAAGVRLRYPANWLLERGDGPLFRAVDVQHPRYETLLQIRVIPVRKRPPASGNSVLYSLSLEYAGSLANFRTLDFVTQSFGSWENIRGMNYAFVSSASNPFIPDELVSVRGLDLALIQRGQAFVISFRAAADEYEALWPFFLRFAESLEI